MEYKDLAHYKNDPVKYWREEYSEKCENCGETHRVLTQPDQHPEYYTEVGIPCRTCGHVIWFDLPVN